MKVLVTGSNGYIGSVLMDTLAELGYKPIGLDVGWFRSCLLYRANVHPTVYIDLRDMNPSSLPRVDAICHLAGLCNDPLGALNEQLTKDINVNSTVKLADMARAAGIRRFVFSSSCSLYGAQPNDQLANETCPLYPQTAYARAKADAEQELSKMASESFSPTFLRNATVYGLSPRLRVDVVANNLLGSAIVHNEIRVLSDGTPWRPIIHVKDVCMAFATAIAAPLEAIHNQAFNIGSWDENYQVKDIAQIVSRATGARVSINTEASPDMRSYRVDFNKAKERLGFRAQQTLSGSLPEMIDGYTKNGFDKESLHGFLFNRLMYIKALQEMNLLTSDLFWS